MKIDHHSPSSLNLYTDCLSLYVLQKILGVQTSVGPSAHRGTAVEDGVTHGLMNPDAELSACVEIAVRKYRELTDDEKLSGAIPEMVKFGLEELRPYSQEHGAPLTQLNLSWHPEGLNFPIVGRLDYYWDKAGVLVDLKTSATMPSEIPSTHARQVAFYAEATSDNVDPLLTYITPKKHTTYRLENRRAHLNSLYETAKCVERFLALSDDPKWFTSIIAPDYGHWKFNGPARQIAFNRWGF